LSVLVAAVLSGDDEGDDGVCGDEASRMVVVARWIGWRRRAKRRPELTVLAARKCAIPAAWSRSRFGFREREERRGGIYRGKGGGLGEGLRLGRRRFASDGSGLRRVRPGLVEDDV
jgi:hypothetical protein